MDIWTQYAILCIAMVKNRCIRVDDDVWAYWQSESAKARLSIVRWLIEATGTLGMVPAKVHRGCIADPVVSVSQWAGEVSRGPVASTVGEVLARHDIVLASELPKPVRRGKPDDPMYDALPEEQQFSEDPC